MEIDEVIGPLSWDALLDHASPPPQPAPGPPPGGPRWARLMPCPATEARRTVDELARVPPEGGALIRAVRGEYCVSKAGFFEEWTRALKLPGGDYNTNWDAFDECISELVELDEGGRIGLEYGDGVGGVAAVVVVVLVTDSDGLLADEPQRDFRVMASILEDAALGHTQAPERSLAALRVVFQCEPERADALRRRFREVEP